MLFVVHRMLPMADAVPNLFCRAWVSRAARRSAQIAHRQTGGPARRSIIVSKIKGLWMMGFLLLTVPAISGLPPAGTGGFAVEVKTTVSTHTAVVRAGALEGRLRRPGEGTLGVGEVRQVADDVVNSKDWVSMVFVHRWNADRGGGTDLSLVPDAQSVKGLGEE
jgi:hypothetical protein